MKIEFTDEELGCLPESVAALNGTDTDISAVVKAFGDDVPGVSGLKKALEEERSNAQERRSKLAKIRETLGGTDHDDPLELVTRLKDVAVVNQEREQLLRERNDERAKNLISESIMRARGNVFALIPHVKDRVRQDEDGSLTPLASDGKPLQIDGEPADLDGLLGLMSKEAHLSSLFAGTNHSGSGSTPGKGGSGPEPTSDAPPMTTRVSEMTTSQKVAAVRTYGTLEGYPGRTTPSHRSF